MHQTTRILSHAPEAGDLGQWFYCTHSVVQAYATKAGLAYKLPTFRGQWTLQSNQGSQILGRAYCDRVDFATSEPSTAIGQFMGRCQSPRLPISRTCNARGMYFTSDVFRPFFNLSTMSDDFYPITSNIWGLFCPPPPTYPNPK